MIMQWRRQESGNYQATWQGQHLSLELNIETRRWHLYADNVRVKQNWRSAKEAMNMIEIQQQRIVLHAMRVRKAVLDGTA